MSDAAANPQPISNAERVTVIDAVRGFALLGILLMNIESFVGPLGAGTTGIDPALQGADRWADAAVYVLVQGKFYTLFSLLFGAGFAMMLQRAQQAGRDGAGLYARRLLILLAIGVCHAVFVWAGDILLAYALCGFVLLLAFRRTPASRLPWWGLTLYLVPSLLFGALAALTTLARSTPAAAQQIDAGLQEQALYMQQMIDAQRVAYGTGTYAQATAQRIDDTLVLLQSMPWMFGPMVLGMFLIGAWFMRSGALTDPGAHRPLYRWLAAIGWLAGLPLMMASAWLVPSNDFSRLDMEVAVASAMGLAASLLLCLGYLSTFMLLSQGPRGAAVASLLAPAGRMALTLYLLQSVVCTLCFYGYGLGWFEQVPRAWQLPFAFAVFALQLAFAHLWLARFRFGPAEWLWRTLTYGRLQPLRA